MPDAVFQPDWFSRPGDSLVAAIRRRGLTVAEVTDKLPGGRDQLRGYVAGSLPIDRAAAAALAGTVGGSIEFWLKRQENYERDLARATAAVPDGEASVWLSSIPMPGAKRGARATEETQRAEVRRRLALFGVGTLAAWERRYGRDREATRFRTSEAFASSDGALSLWLRQGELEASLADTAAWGSDALHARLSDIVGLSRIAKPARFLPRLKQLLGEAGVALVVLRAPDQCRASGASRLIRPDKAMILLSFRYRSDDQFWFTVLHEIGHLLLHGARGFVDVDDTQDDECEQEANKFAASLIVPAQSWGRFEELELNHQQITRFAVSIGVGAGLVLGRLQYLGRVPRERMNFLRRHWTWREIEEAIASL
jgi:Zn-dependent peptidase ImmA (M78 family)/plasmid maintenance system antidote protein VapI